MFNVPRRGFRFVVKRNAEKRLRDSLSGTAGNRRAIRTEERRQRKLYFVFSTVQLYHAGKRRCGEVLISSRIDPYSA